MIHTLENWLNFSNRSFSRDSQVGHDTIQCDCSGFINLLFSKLDLPFPYQLKRPKAVHYYAILQEIGGNSIDQLKQGHLLAWRKDTLPKSGDTGHVLVTAGEPTQINKDHYEISVVDSTKAENGLAKRQLQLYTDEKDTIIGVRFHEAESKVKRTAIYHQSLTASRYCFGCGLPVKVCLCNTIEPTLDVPPIMVLRHTSERKRTMSTVSLIKQRYPAVLVKEGEVFSPLRQENLALLFPSGAESDQTNLVSGSRQTLILIDATWRKAKKILHVNPWLRELPKVSLQPESVSRYLLRKVANEQALSSVESFAAVMQDDKLTNMFSHFMQKQIDIMGRGVYEKNYKGHLNFTSPDNAT